VGKKKKEDLPVFVVVTMPDWQDRIFQILLKLFRVKGKAWVITVEGAGFSTDGKYYTHEETGVKVSKKEVGKNAQGD